MSLTPHEAAEMLADGCDHLSTREELEQRLAAGERLHVKLGSIQRAASCIWATRSC